MRTYFYDYRLPKSEIAAPHPYKKPWWDAMWVRNIITVSEVVFDLALSFIPGINTLDPSIIATELIVNELGNTILFEQDRRNNNVKWWNSSLYFGGPIFGVAFQEFINIKRINKLSKLGGINKTYLEMRTLENKDIKAMVKTKKTLEKSNFIIFLKKIGLPQNQLKKLENKIYSSSENNQNLIEAKKELLNVMNELKKLENVEHIPERAYLLKLYEHSLEKVDEKYLYSYLIGTFKEVSKKYKVLKSSDVNSASKWMNIWSKDPDLNTWEKFNKITGSKLFRNKVVKSFQWINPSMVARKPINYIYNKLYKYFGDWFDKLLGKNVRKIVEYTDIELTKMIENGEGITLNSEWLDMLRIIDPNPEINLCILTFQNNVTSGKEAVLFWATLDEIKKLILSPGSTYINLFAISRGGKSTGILGLFGIKFKGMDKSATKFLTKIVNILPINSLRNILSIAGNIKREALQLKKGTYFSTFMNRFEKSFISYGVGRITREVARGILAQGLSKSGIFDHIVGKILKTEDKKIVRREIHRFLTMEIGRYSTAIFSYGFKNEIKGESFSHGLGKRLAYAISRTPRDHLAHFERELGSRTYLRNPAILNIKMMRQGKIYRRVPSLFMTTNFKNKIKF